MTKLTCAHHQYYRNHQHQHHNHNDKDDRHLHRHQHQHHHHHHHHHHCNHDQLLLTPQYEKTDPLSHRNTSLVHRQTASVSPPTLDPGYSPQGHASPTTLPITTLSDIRHSAEPCPADKARQAEDPLLTYRILHADVNILTVDLDRMSDHDPSSGEGEEEPPSPATNPHQGKPQWAPPPPTSVRSPYQGGARSTNPPMTGRGSSSKAVTAQSDGRQALGQSKSWLQAEKVFPIQVGSEIFRLSGASIASDGPSYFTQFFEEQVRQNEETGGVKTLYIDRDPETFRDIARHLQGYYLKPRDGPHFVRLFADAQFYSLPRLISQLFESEIFIQIGEQHFQIPKDIFSEPGNSPNFFSLGFAVFFSTPSDAFPGLDRRGLLRPPPINPPYVPGRSSEIFGQLLHLLRGYPVRVKNEEHRAELLRDCRYFHLRGLEQRIIAHDISYNLNRQKSEICLRLNDLKPSGISYRPDETDSGSSGLAESGWVHYARPFVDEQSYELIVEIGGESTILDLDKMRVDFYGKTKARVSSLFQVIANKMGLPSNQPLGVIMLSGGTSKRSPSPGHSSLSEDQVRVRFETITDITLDSAPLDLDWDCEQGRHMRTGAIRAMSVIDDGGDDSSESTDDSRIASSHPSPAAVVGPLQHLQTRGSKSATATTTTTTNINNNNSSSSSSRTPVTNTSNITIKTQRSLPPPPPPQASSTSSSSSAYQRHDKSPVPTTTTTTTTTPDQRPNKRRKVDSVRRPGHFGRWTVRNGQWRLRVEQSTNASRGRYEIVFIAVKIDAFTNEGARNARRSFLN